MDVKIESSWKDALAPEFGRPYFEQLVRFLHQEKEAGKVIYPRGSQIFHAFDLTPLDQVKVVILGQDPYHGPGQAMGLSFSVPNGVPAPPSLRNIFQEVETDLGIRMSGATSLEPWARQGVLLLNSVLTVEAGQPTSHSGIGWQQFTDAVISTLSERRRAWCSSSGADTPSRNRNSSTGRNTTSCWPPTPLRWRGGPSSAAGTSPKQMKSSPGRVSLP